MESDTAGSLSTRDIQKTEGSVRKFPKRKTCRNGEKPYKVAKRKNKWMPLYTYGAAGGTMNPLQFIEHGKIPKIKN